MRQSIGGTWLLQLMIVFILLFSGFIILTLNYSRTVKTKNELINMFEKYEGLNTNSIELVNNYLTYTGYSTTGECVDTSTPGVYGALDLSGRSLETARPDVEYYYCVRKYDGANTTHYYQITIFYKLNLPIVGDISTFSVRGSTSNIISSDEDAYSRSISN